MTDKRDRDPFSSLPEFARELVRAKCAESYIAGMRTLGYRSIEEAVRAAGYARVSDYFAASLASPMTANRFLNYLHSFHINPGSNDTRGAHDLVRKFVRDAIISNQPFLNRDDHVGKWQNDWGKRTLDPRGALLWLLTIPTARALVPTELREFLESSNAKHLGGRPPEYDWKMVETRLEAECKLQESVPHRGHSDKSWRTKSDAYRFIRDSFNWRSGGPSEATMKANVGPILDRIGAKFSKAGN